MDELLKLLRDDASLTPSQIAARLDRDESEIDAQIKSMEEDGVILGYRTVINENKLEVDLVRAVIEVKITPEREGGFGRLASRIAKFDEVRSCYLMSGGFFPVGGGGGLGPGGGSSLVGWEVGTIPRDISPLTPFFV